MDYKNGIKVAWNLFIWDFKMIMWLLIHKILQLKQKYFMLWKIIKRKKKQNIFKKVKQFIDHGFY